MQRPPLPSADDGGAVVIAAVAGTAAAAAAGAAEWGNPNGLFEHRPDVEQSRGFVETAVAEAAAVEQANKAVVAKAAVESAD